MMLYFGYRPIKYIHFLSWSTAQYLGYKLSYVEETLRLVKYGNAYAVSVSLYHRIMWFFS